MSVTDATTTPAATTTAATTTAATTAGSTWAAVNQPGPPPPPPALPALPALPSHPTRIMAALSLLAVVRAPVLRPNRTTNPARPTNLEAELGQLTGQVQVPMCTHCVGGSGPWTECVVVAGFFLGSCANCHYGSEGHRCSLRMLLVSWPFTDRD
jgi:hypothetical protein